MKNLSISFVRGLDFSWDIDFTNLNEVSLFNFAWNSGFNFFGVGSLVLG